MVVTIGNFAIAGMLVIGVLCIIILGIAVLADADSDNTVIFYISTTCIILWIICVVTAIVTHTLFTGDFAKHKLKYLTTTKHEQLVKQCPNEEGHCRIKWLDYRADSLKAEYQVQMSEFDD